MLTRSVRPSCVRVLHISVRVEHPVLLIDGQTQFLDSPSPLCPDSRPLATASNGAFEFRIDAEAPDGGPLAGQPPSLEATGSAHLRVVGEFGTLDQPGSGPLLRVEASLDSRSPEDFFGTLLGRVKHVEQLPFGPLAVCSHISPWRIHRFTVRRVV